jgi:hypothetical protein
LTALGSRNCRMSKMTLQLILIQNSDLRRLHHAIQHFKFTNQRLQALVGTYSEYCKLVDRSELVLNDILKWAKDQVLRDLYSKRMTSKADGMRVAEAGFVFGESYLIEKCVDYSRAG